MGGFGAIRLGLKHPDLFSSIWAHSSTVPTTKVKRDWPFIWDSPDHSEEWKARMKIDLSCYHWAEQLDRAQMPRLSFDCGTEDFLIEENRAFHTFLESIDFPHHYAEHPGAHTWEYWDTHVVTALTQHAEVFGIARAPEPVWPPVEESS
jgi:putative tributyrin esterase